MLRYYFYEKQRHLQNKILYFFCVCKQQQWLGEPEDCAQITSRASPKEAPGSGLCIEGHFTLAVLLESFV